MEYNNLIELEIWSEFGSFTKGFATSGGVLTYPIPPKTTIIGMIGAVLGIKYDSYEEIDDNIRKYEIEELYNVKISIQPCFDLNNKRVTFNQVRTSILNIHQDVLINPRYLIYLAFPESLKDKENLFIENIKSNKTVYSLYMGRNEFLLNYKLKNIVDYNSINVNNENIDEFFEDNPKIYGTVNKSNIRNLSLANEDLNEIEFSFIENEPVKIPSYFEYIINDFPVKRENFTDFTFSTISFFTFLEDKDVYFDEFELKEDKNVDLVSIGDNKWIMMI